MSQATTDTLLAGHTALPTIETERLAIRWLTAADVPALYAIFSSAEVTRYFALPTMTSVQEAEELLATIQRGFAARCLFQWGVARRSDDLVVGTCTLASINAEHRRAEVGFALGRQHWRQGYIAETLAAMLRFAFHSLGLNRIEADVDPRNEPSLKALERLGFQREGYQRQRYFLHGEWQDSVLLGLVKGEWQPRSSPSR